MIIQSSQINVTVTTPEAACFTRILTHSHSFVIANSIISFYKTGEWSQPSIFGQLGYQEYSVIVDNCDINTNAKTVEALGDQYMTLTIQNSRFNNCTNHLTVLQKND